MSIELLAHVKSKSEADLWNVPPVQLAIPAGARVGTYTGYNVAAADDKRGTVLGRKWVKTLANYPDIRYLISTLLEDPNDARNYSSYLESVSRGTHTPIYMLRDLTCLSGVPDGSHVGLYGQVKSGHRALDGYHVWCVGAATPRKQWQEFCELCTRGIIPVGVYLPTGEVAKGLTGRVYRRDLVAETSTGGSKWRKATSVQNIISHWETIQGQMERISRAGRETSMGSEVRYFEGKPCGENGNTETR